MPMGLETAAWMLSGLVGGAGALLGIGALTIAYFSTHPPRHRFRRTPADFGAPFEEVAFPAHDGTPLSGWYVPAPNARAVLLLTHGMSADRTQMLPWAEWLWADGFSLLLFDFRALGRSGGSLCTMGLYEAGDVRGAVDYLAARPDTQGLPLGIFGFSMGGVSAILAAAEEPRLAAVVAHGAYADLDRAIAQRCRRHFGPLGPLVEWSARRIGQRWFPASSGAVSCLRNVPFIAPRPLLLLNGARDPIVLPSNAQDLYAAACAPKDLRILPRSTHDYPHPSEREEYRQRLLGFFRAALVR